MAHQEQQQFFSMVKGISPGNFKGVKVIDCGSLYVNGSLKDYFEDSEYLGVDIVAGRNVNLVSPVHKLEFNNEFDTVISGEMLEHDEFWKQSLQKMYDMCKSGGLIAISCAGKDRPEHGTTRTGIIWGTSNDYYMNLEPSHIKAVYKPEMFTEMHISENHTSKDTYFYGIKL